MWFCPFIVDTTPTATVIGRAVKPGIYHTRITGGLQLARLVGVPGTFHSGCTVGVLGTVVSTLLCNNKSIFAQCRGGMDSKLYGDRRGAHNEHRATAFPSV